MIWRTLQCSCFYQHRIRPAGSEEIVKMQRLEKRSLSRMTVDQLVFVKMDSRIFYCFGWCRPSRTMIQDQTTFVWLLNAFIKKVQQLSGATSLFQRADYCGVCGSVSEVFKTPVECQRYVIRLGFGTILSNLKASSKHNYTFRQEKNLQFCYNTGGSVLNLCNSL